MRRFEITEVSGGGIGLTGYGRTLEELFAHLALGMFGVRADVTAVQPMATVPIFAHAEGVDAVLLGWLRELVMASARDGLVFMNCRVRQVAETAVGGEAMGEAYDPQRHPLLRDIASVTSSEPVVRRDGALWVAQVTLA